MDGETLFGTRLRIVRETRGLTQYALSKLAGIPPSAIAHFECGDRLPSYVNLQRLGRALDVSGDYLLGLSPVFSAGAGDTTIQHLMVAMTKEERDLILDFVRMLCTRDVRTR